MKLNLRDLFWLILVAAVVTAWWLERAKLTEQVRQLEVKAKKWDQIQQNMIISGSS